MTRSLLSLVILSIGWATAMVSTVVDPVAVYYALRLGVALEYLYYVPLVGLLLLFTTGWLVVRLTAKKALLMPLAGVSVILATFAMSVLGSLDKDSRIVEPTSLLVGLGTSLPVATFLAVASIALPWWLWHRSQTTSTR